MIATVVVFDSVAPVVPVRDLDAALARYERMGFTTRRYDGPERYGFADRGGVSLHLNEWGEHDPLRTAGVVYLYVSDADAVFAEWSRAGIEGQFREPFDTDYGLREFAFVDVDGTLHRVGSRPPRSAFAGERRTERLTLRGATAADVEATFAYRRLPEVGEWITHLPADLASYTAVFTQPERLAATIIGELDGVIIGDFMIRVEDAWSQAEVAEDARGRQAVLGWVLDPAYTGHGYATEAVRELLRVCFEELGIHRVLASCFAANTTSWRLMERVGMRRETAGVRDSLHRSGQWLDGYTYALLADEWR